MCHMTLLSHLKAIQFLTLKGNSVSHTDQFDVSHNLVSHLKAIQYLTLKDNSVST
jgi:hypothetical protein